MKLKCPFCTGPYTRSGPGYSHQSKQSHYTKVCAFCGFYFDGVDYYFDTDIIGEDRTVATLKKVSINDEELALTELGTHLKRRFSDVYLLSPRRFEMLVGDVFRQLGFDVRLTQQTRDGGYDIVLLEQASGTQAIIECKRYAKNRVIHVGTVRELLGVQLVTGIAKAYLVSTTHFTKPALETAIKVSEGPSLYELNLIGADELFRALSIYNESLPPLYVDARFTV